MSAALTQALDALRVERDATVARVAALDMAIAQLIPLVNPQDVPAGSPIVRMMIDEPDVLTEALRAGLNVVDVPAGLIGRLS